MSLSSSHRRRSRRFVPGVAVVALVTLFSPFIAFQPATAGEGDPDEPVLIQFEKDAIPAAPTAVGPGQTVTYQFTINCSSLETDCLDLTLADSVPAPLVLQSVTMATQNPPIDIQITGNDFTVEVVDDLGGGATGMQAGTGVQLNATATVPANLSADFDGTTLVNTAVVTVSNRADLTLDPPRPNVVESSAEVLLAVPRVLGSNTTKDVTPATSPAVQGRSVAFALGATNTSNGSVDELVMQEPADPSSSILTYVEITGLSGLSLPAGANRVRVDWFDGADWNVGTPAASAALPPGVDTADLRGLRFVFTSTTGRVDRGATAAITIEGELTSTAAAVPSTLTVTNTASSWVRFGDDSTTPVLAADTIRLDPTSVSPVASKQFENSYVIGGVLERVTIGGQNGGDFPLKEMTLTEPAPGSTSLAGQGLSFDGWVTADIEWPVGATSAEVSYWYEGDADFSAPVTTTTVDTIPAPVDAELVQSIRVRFISTLPGGMAPGQYASLPFRVLTGTVETDVTTVNQVRVDVVTLDDQTGTALASDDLTRRTSRVNTLANKTITPDTLYGVEGATTLISLPSSITPLPTSAVDPTSSTVGSVSLVITDPVDSAADEFWNHFDLTNIVATAVPANTTLTVEYFTGSEWLVLPGADALLGPTFLNTTISGSLREQISAIRFTYQHRDFETLGTLLNPGFTVQPNLRFALRDELRDGTGDAASATRTESIELTNTVSTAVTNPVATPPEATDDAVASIELLPTNDGSGGGTGNISAISKDWQPVPSTGFEAVNARSGEQATARIRWGTAGTTFHTVVLSDTASDPATTPVGQTVFEAFNLVRIPAITSGVDSRLTFDRVAAVQLYIPGSGWVDASGSPCPASCDGTFPGYTLTTAERTTATGVRLIIEESPTRAARIGTNPAAPPVGSGVAASMNLDRRFDLVFEVRDVRRSDPSVAVLGSTREALYNTGSFGVVNNTVRFDGRDADNAVVLTRTSADSIQIFDQPLTIEVTKTWVDGPLGTPPDGTPQEFYPRARMTIEAENTSVSRVDELSILDPVAGTDPFDAVNLFDIVSLTVPSGATDTVVILERESGDFDSFTRTAALALMASQLADVVGIEVVHTGRIDVQATTRLVVDTQLREFLRSAPATRVTAATSAFVPNTVRATISDPGGLTQPPEGQSNNTLIAQATASVSVENLSYGVTATKGIQADTTATITVPATQFEGNSRIATVTLTGQPSGNVRSTDMVFEDLTPSFWNAYNFTGFGSHSFASPLNRVKVDVLIGVDYVIDGSGGITAECGGSAVLDDCWVEGAFGSTLTLPTLPPGAVTADIRGVRFHYTRADGAAWERPFNPLQTVRFTVTRRDLLVEPSDQPVPSTLYIYDEPAPGESQIGIFTNDVTVTSWADDGSDAPLWQATADDTRQILFQHRPAKVRVIKTPFGPLTLGAPIPYEIEVRNLGTGHDKDLAELQIVDLIPVDLSGPMLVLGIDPETGVSYLPEDLISLSLVNTSGTAVAAPSFTAVLGASGPGGQALTITPDPAFVLPKGWTLTIKAPLLFRQFLEAGSESSNFVLNSAIVTSDQEFDRCEYSTNGALELDPQLFVSSCTATTKVWALPSAPMNIVKGVKGVEAGPLDLDGNLIIDPDTGLPFDDLGVIRTVNNGIDCSAPTLDVDGTDYYRYPCVPITRPGGTEEWVGNFFNAGNVRVFEVVAIDVLPRQNDRGVIINDARSSRWAPVLTERPRLVGWPDEALTVYYTDRLDLATPQCNGADIQFELGMNASSTPPMVQSYLPCITSGSPGGLPDRADPITGWKVMPSAPDAALLESVIALKFVVDFTVGVDVADHGLVPGDDISIVYRSQTASEPVLRETNANLARDSIAYNSIAGAARGRDGDNDLPYRFVTEPRKVGVALATGAIDLAKVVDGAAAAFAPATFAIDVACSVDGEPISLLDSAGNNRSPFTLTGNAASTRILGIPLYAECDITEVGTTGATTTAALPQTVTVRSLDSSPSVVFNPRPAFDERDPIELSEVTNTYESASLTISKTVNMNGAVNAAGAPVMQTSFTFSIACTFNVGAGPQPVSVTPATFTLNDGESRTYTGLPAGAVCTVTETNTRGATVTKTITTGGASTEPNATTAVVTLSPDAEGGAATNTVAYTNSIPVASLTVNKVLTGAGATQYGTGTFTIRVSCTKAATVNDMPTGAPTNSVWYGTFTLSSASGLSRTIDNIPAGSSCTVTETESAGATQVTTQGAITLTASPTVTRSVTNRFALASLVVGKTVQTAAVDAEGNPVYPIDPFAFEVACTFQGGTVLATGFAASPMTFALRHGETRTLAGLPAGASCVVTETDDLDADSTSIARTVNATSTSIEGTSTTIASLAEDVSGAPRNSTQFTNRYGVTSFTISKDVIGGAAGQFAPESFTANLVCTSPLVGESFNDDLTVPANGFVTIENLADGSTCTVFERDVAATGADAHRIVDDEGTVIDGTDILVTTGNPASVTLENYYLTGELEVSKSVIGAGAVYGDGPFEVTLACVRDGIAVDIAGGATRELAPDGTVSYTLLPSGAECTLTETDRGSATSSRVLDENGDELTTNVGTGYTFTVIVDASELVDDQPQPSLEVENTFELASLAVSKTVSSAAVDQNGDAIEFGPFPVTVDCLFQSVNVYGTGYDAETQMQRELVDGETWVLTGLPDGAVCTVTETDTMSAVETRITTVRDGAGSSTTTSSSAVVTLGTETTAEIMNDYTVGSIELSKAVIGEGTGEWADAPFEIDVTCVLDDSTGERVVFSHSFTFVRGDDPVTIENLASGALCTITETATGGASSTTVTIDGDSVSGVTADVVIADDLVAATVTNTFGLGEVRVEKVRDGEGADTWGAGPFEVELSCVRDIDGVDEQIEIPGGALRLLTSEGFYRATYDLLPIDAVCSLVETRTAGATSTSIDVDAVTVGAAPVQFTVTNTFDVGSVAIEKTFAGDGTGLFVQGPYEASLACTLEIDGVITDLEIPGGAARELTEVNGYRNGWHQIPAGAECSVTETRTGGATRVDAVDAEFTVEADEQHTVILENTFLLAAFSITKDVTGPFAHEARDAVFLIETECVWDRDGEQVPLLPGGWPRESIDQAESDDEATEQPTSVRSEIRHGVTVTFDNLPASAVCSVSEVDSGGATMQLMWLDGVLQLGELTLADGENDSTLANVFMLTLANTGVEIMLWLWVIAALLFSGLVLLTIARRRASAG
ncbi:MAG: hypothetical protein KIT89_11260 [Microcella sp.]|uniref:DUF5979 domain-containing protein n=1 Tax=Microcella sp. TaxID=1913979 RepID=UPI0024C61030|nr:DUF5979 domain-containing protein [Microcella sp.]UYN83265.1 MAG: hypothetical protein KIT89_11260 [Microcella sp.]